MNIYFFHTCRGLELVHKASQGFSENTPENLRPFTSTVSERAEKHLSQPSQWLSFLILYEPSHLYCLEHAIGVRTLKYPGVSLITRLCCAESSREMKNSELLTKNLLRKSFHSFLSTFDDSSSRGTIAQYCYWLGQQYGYVSSTYWFIVHMLHREKVL